MQRFDISTTGERYRVIQNLDHGSVERVPDTEILAVDDSKIDDATKPNNGVRNEVHGLRIHVSLGNRVFKGMVSRFATPANATIVMLPRLGVVLSVTRMQCGSNFFGASRRGISSILINASGASWTPQAMILPENHSSRLTARP
jgi:hypothetical protein